MTPKPQNSMKYISLLLALFVFTSCSNHNPPSGIQNMTVTSIEYLSRVHGEDYRSEKLTKKNNTVGTLKPRENRFIEPVSNITLANATQLADKAAQKIIGKSYKGAHRTWELKQATKERSALGYYYLISFKPLDGLKAKSAGDTPSGMGENLQLVVLLDGTILKLKKN